MGGFEERIGALRALAKERGLNAIVLRRNPNLAWAIGGRVHVPQSMDAACFDLIVSAENVVAITNVIEGPRLLAEEFPAGVEVQMIPWWEGRDPKLPTGASVGSDQPGADRIDLNVEIEILRQSLVEEDIARFKTVCIDAAIALGKAMKSIQQSDREIDVAGRITQALWDADLEIAFLGVAGTSRVAVMKHPLPTTAGVGNKVVASICAKRKGLIASATRIVMLNGAAIDSGNYEALLKVEADILDATQIGVPFSEPVLAASKAYGANGFDPNEWHKHHQGGPTGYLPRDWPANLNSSRLIAKNQPISWNPTGAGLKVEDTVITSTNGPVLLTNDPNWPSISVRGRQRPGILAL